VAATAAVAITEPTDKSRPRTMMTKVWPITTMPSGATCCSMFEMLLPLRKAGEAISAIASNKAKAI